MLVVVAFVSQKGGVGKSTLARALATVAAAARIKVKLADLDPRQQTVARWEERRQENEAGPALDVASFQTAAQAIQACGTSGELLIVDAPAGTSKATLEIAKHADLIVQPSGAGIDDLDPAIILFHELVREGVPLDRLVMALCRVATQVEEECRPCLCREGRLRRPAGLHPRACCISRRAQPRARRHRNTRQDRQRQEPTR